jgi:hypothetical protein
MNKTYGVIQDISNKYSFYLENYLKSKKSLNDSDDEMIIKYHNETK